MNVRSTLEHDHCKASISAVARHVGQDAKRLKEVTSIFFGTDTILSQRAAWAFSEIIRLHPEMLKPYWPRLVKVLAEPSKHDAVPRNIMRMCEDAEIPAKYETQILDLCFKFIPDPRCAIAVRAYAVTVAARICKPYPELFAELKLMLAEVRARGCSAGMQVRIKRVLNDSGAAVPS